MTMTGARRDAPAGPTGPIAMMSESEWDGAVSLRDPQAPVRRVLRLCRPEHLLGPGRRTGDPEEGDA